MWSQVIDVRAKKHEALVVIDRYRTRGFNVHHACSLAPPLMELEMHVSRLHRKQQLVRRQVQFNYFADGLAGLAKLFIANEHGGHK